MMCEICKLDVVVNTVVCNIKYNHAISKNFCSVRTVTGHPCGAAGPPVPHTPITLGE